MNGVPKSITLNILFCTAASWLHAQTDLTKFEIGINGGVFIYQGDLTPARLGSYRTLKPGFSVYLNRILTPTISLRTNLALGELKGDDSKYLLPTYRQQRNFNFKSPVVEFSELVVADLRGNSMARKLSGLSPYMFAGFGISFLTIRRDWSRFNAEYFSAEAGTLEGLATDLQHSPPRAIPVLPIGAGLRYPISTRISLSAETSYRFAFTDYLDGFSRAADPSRKDSYLSHNIGIIYHFVKPNSLKCPVPKY